VEYPRELSYFRCPPEVEAVFGKQPKSLLVMLPTENDEKVIRQYYAVYGGNQKLLCQGDGQNAERRVDGHIEKMACPGPNACEFAKDPKRPGLLRCGARIDLMVVLPSVNMGGVYQISSGSVVSDMDVRSGVEMTRNLYARISWVPMNLTREETKIPDPVTGKMNPHWTLRLYPIGTIQQVNEGRKDTQRIVDVTEQYLLPEPVIEGETDTPTVYEEESPPEGQDQPKSHAEMIGPPVPPAVTESNEKLDFMTMLSDCRTTSEVEKLWTSCMKSIIKMPGPDRVDLQTAKDKKLTKLRNPK